MVMEGKRNPPFESFVFVKEEELPLSRKPLRGGGMRVLRSADWDSPDLPEYVEGKDYSVDYERGTIRRIEGSRIPDGSMHPCYGIEKFDHRKYEDYGNRAYTVYAVYEGEPDPRLEQPSAKRRVSDLIPKSAAKLSSGRRITMVVYGDSISAGGDASHERFTFYGRFADYVMGMYPEGNIRIRNRAIGGETSEGGASRVESSVVPEQPDVVTIGYGMNDQNLYEHGLGVSLHDFERNLRHMIQSIRSNSEADIVLITPCEPNPLWLHTSGRIGEYAEVIRRLGKELGLGVADAHAQWREELSKGKTPESLLLNNVNHPNDYGHYLYFLSFISVD